MADTDLAVQRLERAQGARRAARDGRLRHGLLVAELPQPVPGRRPQDGPLVPARRRRRRTPTASPPRSSRSARRCSSRSSPRASSTPSSGRRCATLGCDLGQGFLFARPMDADAALEFLRARRRRGAGRRRRRCTIATRGSTAPAASAASGLLAPLRHRDFRLLWSGMCVSLLGDGIFLVAMAWQVYALSNAPDRAVDRRHRDDGADDRVPARRRRGQRPLRPPPRDARRRPRRAASRSALLARAVADGRARALARGRRSSPSTARARRSSARPSTRSSPTCCPRDELAQANSLDQFVRPIALRLAGPALGGVLIDAVGVGAAFALDAAVVRRLGRARCCRCGAAARRAAGAARLDGRRHPRGLRFVRGARLAVGARSRRGGRLPAVHGPGRGAAALRRQERASAAAPPTSAWCSPPAASARSAARS